MEKALQIFRRDLRRILRNPVAVVVTLGVCVIPSLYAWLNVLANWDPYKNTQGVSVAVANNDRGAEVAGMGFVDAGDMVVQELGENDQLDWQFVDESEAVDGVTSGRYFAAIVLPETFTQELSGVLSGDVSSPKVTYYVNEKLNPIAPKVTDTGANTIESKIDETFVATASKVVIEKMQGAGDQVSASANEAAEGAGSRLREASGTLSELEEKIAGARETISSARTTASSAAGTLDSLAGAADGASTTLAEATDELASARSGRAGLARSLSTTLAEASSLATGVSGRTNAAIGTVSGRVAAAQSTVDGYLAQARRLNEENKALLDQLEEITPSVGESLRPRWDALLEELRGQQEADERLVASLQTASDGLKADAAAVSGLSSTIDGAVGTTSSSVLDAQVALTSTALPALDGALDSLSSAAGGLTGGLGGVRPTIEQAEAVLAQLDGTLADADEALGLTQDELASVREALDGVATDVAAVQSSEALARIDELGRTDASAVAAFMSSPVTIDERPVFPVANYGSGVAPFYTNLALWVGGFVLVAIYKVEVDGEGVGRFKPWQGYFGRWLLFVALGELQGLICCLGDLALGIQCVSPALFVLAGLVESFVYVNLIYAFSVAFKHVGKALCVLLVILQIPGSAGTYPIEMMPGFFQAIHPWLPFTYGIDAMREAVAGAYGSYFATNLLMLLLFLVPALVVGVALRRPLINVNVLFDRRLADTDLMICERYGTEVEHYRLALFARTLMHSEEYRRRLARSLERFGRRYPQIQRRGFVSLLALPIGLAVAMFVSPQPAKLPLFVLWIVTIVALCALLIVTEYLHDSLERRMAVASLTTDEVFSLLGRELDDQGGAFAGGPTAAGADATVACRYEDEGDTGADDAAGRGGDAR
ncbi:MAG: YhgE/Pip domain-containing protein [Atopobiaceae bacterium]|nr:YhgE/Pip domain-containing protein [Atopobiaceae bacterium]